MSPIDCDSVSVPAFDLPDFPEEFLHIPKGTPRRPGFVGYPGGFMVSRGRVGEAVHRPTEENQPAARCFSLRRLLVTLGELLGHYLAVDELNGDGDI